MHRRSSSHDRKQSLSELMSDIESEEVREPPLPAAGVPSQKLPGIIRWPIRVLLLPFMWLDLFAQNIAKILIPPPYRQEGGCLQRGKCCHYILIEEPKHFFAKPLMFWSTEINGFYRRDIEPFEYEGRRMQVMGCRYLKNGKCQHYRLRPMICRQWPLIEYFGRPKILKGCGYRAVPRNPPPNNHLTKEKPNNSNPKVSSHRLNILK